MRGPVRIETALLAADVTGTAVFFLSDLAAVVTGQMLPLTGANCN